MPDSPQLKFGILKARDLVELYFGARMVANIIENEPANSGQPAPLIGADPRRIKYEIIISEGSGAAFAIAAVGSQASFDNGTSAIYSIPPGGTQVITRDFFTDLDSVCLELWGAIVGGQISFSTRETYLTPVPVDQLP
jgi:hypothetical protein